ncbi:MAG: iron-sulfur cluster assembly accessory protein [Gammaproteobacteria bacterium]|nr:MAG: iron-sulfur cluster assembly accessory protein [Gammaproteobacteria bacterium]TDJ37807.1 MAG: iron-sulfur cluster assembly accessory protein [Gammaproteobacteria bacterium]
MTVETRVETFDPATQIDISMSDAAVDHVLGQRSEAAQVLRLSLTESGCSGYMYQLDHEAEPAPDDRPVQIRPNLTLYVAVDHLALLQGTRIDYVTEGLNSLVKFNNPNAQSECGCGESFSIDSDLPD